MIFISAKIKCDRCDNTVDINLEYSVGAQKIPVLSPECIPTGWAETTEHGYGFTSTTVHLCPDHKR